MVHVALPVLQCVMDIGGSFVLLLHNDPDPLPLLYSLSAPTIIRILFLQQLDRRTLINLDQDFVFNTMSQPPPRRPLNLQWNVHGCSDLISRQANRYFGLQLVVVQCVLHHNLQSPGNIGKSSCNKSYRQFGRTYCTFATTILFTLRPAQVVHGIFKFDFA